MIRPVPHVADMAAYALADLGDPDIISLAQNESAFPVSPQAILAGQKALDQMPLYPDPEWPEMRAAIADVHGLAPQNILCGAGSMELIGCLIRAYAGVGDRVLGTDYGYAYIASATAQVQADYVKAREIDLTVSVDDILSTVTPNTQIVFVCNPGNPTGTLIANSELIRLRENLSSDVLLVVDQAYAEFSDVVENPKAIFDLAARGDTVVMRTLSKAYGLAGARAGWGYFPAEIAHEVRKLLNPNNISIPSQAMAAAALRDQAHMQNVVQQTAAIRDRFAADCRELGLTVPQSHTNFALLRFENVKQAQEADAALRANKLLMRGMGGYGLADCLRATICNEDVMRRCVTVLREV
ncbi:Histidinol-phosphate aminotransferase 2 [Roseovarius albus]|uniref:Histidinol-phosphate aminotransferase 2 n=1 Tax=Roseovarius albus TaxID=1247867 RepID=A0A1X6YU23_9RHOB|nr:histidinol-phosphate transaminase [Roseovarius albus]SLN29352.1 Histidinol-phosphate aminotransferase 2 [Roseovarius albus]